MAVPGAAGYPGCADSRGEAIDKRAEYAALLREPRYTNCHLRPRFTRMFRGASELQPRTP